MNQRMMLVRRIVVWVLVCSWGLLVNPAWGETLRLPVVQDNSIVMVDGEWEVNGGKNSRIRIKGNQHIVVMSFDMSALRGRRVRRALLECAVAAEKIAGVTISTIAAPWKEFESNGLTSGWEPTHGWGYPGARFPAVSGGNSFTLVHATPSEVRAELYRWEVPADLVHALATGVAYGLAIHEHDADYRRNPTIYSREQSGKKPVLLVELDDQADPLPLPPTQLELVAVDANSARLTLQAPATGFAYEIQLDDEPLKRHNIPLVSPGATQMIPLRDFSDRVLRAGMRTIRVTTLNRNGQRSAPAEVRGHLFASDVPVFRQANRAAAANAAAANGAAGRHRVSADARSEKLKAANGETVRAGEVHRQPNSGRAAPLTLADLAVIPVLDKYDDQGHPVGDLPDDYRTRNRLFDGQTIRVTAAAGEVVGFQVLLKGPGEVSVQCELDNLPWRVDLFRAVYVQSEGRRIPDPLLPLTGPVRLDPKSETALFVDIYVPFDASAGKRRGQLRVSDGRVVPLELTVLPVQLPRKASFVCEMNSYGLPDQVADYYALQQIAYDHRVHINILHYSHQTAAPGARKSNLDMRLSSGRRMDNRRYDAIEPGAKQGWWDDFVAAFGPYLDGSCFRDGHRGPIAAPGFYLTFHESWPLNCRAYFNGNPDAYQAFASQPVYAETYQNILADFVRVARSRGWTEPRFQVYFNNKGSLGELTKSPWILDEPAAYWDYRALQFYGELTDRGRGGANEVRIDYRIDISRPEYCRGQLQSRSDLWVVSSSAFQDYRRLVADRMERDRLQVWVYGTSNRVETSNRQTLAWAVDAWRGGASGLVPWQTIDKSGRALRQADQLGLFIFDSQPDGKVVMRHSSRLKAYRHAEQLIEYLILVQARQGWSAGQMRAWMEPYTKLAGRVQQQNAEDAGTSEYDAASLLGLDQLRQAAIERLR
jgi:hypothetical protein